MKRRLSQYFEPDMLVRDGCFEDLGHIDSPVSGILAYCETIHYVDRANATSGVTCLIVPSELASRVSPAKGLVIAEKPRNAFYELHERLADDVTDESDFVHPSAIVSRHAVIGRGVVISERVVIRGDVVIGDGCYIDAGAVIGAEGLLYLPGASGNRRIQHRGAVTIGRNAIIHANAVVVRGIHPGHPTAIGDNAIVGVASTIGHEACLERNCVISGNCVIARQASIGEGAWVGSSVTVREYVKIGAYASVKAGSVVIEDVPEHAEVSGNFALPHRYRLLQFLRDKQSG